MADLGVPIFGVDKVHDMTQHGIGDTLEGGQHTEQQKWRTWCQGHGVVSSCSESWEILSYRRSRSSWFTAGHRGGVVEELGGSCLRVHGTEGERREHDTVAGDTALQILASCRERR